MRGLLFGVIGIVLASPLCAQAQTLPAEMNIVVPVVEVRSGPTLKYNPTSKLKQGDRVLVLHKSADQPDWLAITPPPGSFSWINARFVKVVDERTGIVTGDNNNAVALWPGSSEVNDPPQHETVKVPVGSQVTILDQPMKANNESWLRVSPWPTEVRFIPVEAVRLGGSGFTPSVAASNPIIAQADQALQQGNLDKAKQLYLDAANNTQDYKLKAYCYNSLESLSQKSWTAVGNPNTMSNSPQVIRPNSVLGQTTSLTSATVGGGGGAPQTITYPPQWTSWGILRKTAIPEQDGQPVYVLESKTGQPLIYVQTQAGQTLKDYVNRTVCLYGSVTYRSDDVLRTHVIRPSFVSFQ